MGSKAIFSTDVRTSRLVRLDSDGIFAYGPAEPTRLEIRAVDERGELQVLVFEQEALAKLSTILSTLSQAFPGAFPR